MDATPTFLAALAGRNAGRPPLWIMRQAGRTLASYRALRAGHEFLDFCKHVDLATEATLIPIRELGVDAAILFADILLPVEALGLGLRFEEGAGPIVTPAVADAAAVAALRREPVADHCGYIGDIVRKLRAELPAHVPLIGFCPSPWTLAAYVVDGRGKRGFPGLKRLRYGDPEAFVQLLDLLTELLCDYTRLQVEAGAQAFQIFDTWADLATPEDFRTLIRPRVARLAEAARPLPTIYFPKGTAQVVDALDGIPVQGFSCDWTVELPDMRRRLGPKVALQGNLDPGLLYAPPERIRAHAHALLDRMAGDPAYIVNLGHGLSPDIPEAHVRAFVDAVKSWTPR